MRKNKNKHKNTLVHEYRKEMKFYLRFHTESLNRLIHAFTTPLEIYSWVLLLAIITPYLSLAFSLLVIIHTLRVVQVTNCAYFVVLLQVFLTWSAVHTASTRGAVVSLSVGLTIQIVSWFIQVKIGHNYIEKNQPGFMTQLTMNSVLWSHLIAFDETIELNSW